MPVQVRGNNDSSSSTKSKQDAFRKNHGYDYPMKGLKPGSEFHNKIRDRILDRAQASHNVMSRYKDRWREIDQVLRVFVPPEKRQGSDENETKAKRNSDDYADIVIPESYATMETILTYYMNSFMQSPIIQYEGTGPEDVVGARLLTQLIDHQMTRARMGLNLHTMFRDDTVYGFGVVAPMWEKIYGKKPRVRKFGRRREDGVIEVTREERVIENNQLLYEGNNLYNINPYLYLPDVSVPIDKPEKGEYQGWVEETTISDLLSREQGDTFLFNVKYLQDIDGRSQYTVSGEKQKTRDSYNNSNLIARNADVIWMYVDLIPKKWELGKEEYPVKYLMALGGDEVVLALERVEYLHGRTPVAVCASNTDGYSATPVSKLSQVHDIQKLINFMYTSHVHNVRKALNDMFLIDPSIVNYYDMINPEPGKVIRTRRAAWGNQALDQAFKQLNVTDVTQQHVAEASQLGQLQRRISATGNAMQGTVGGDDRTTRISAREAGGAIGASLSRFQKNAQMIDMQAMQPLAMMLAAHTQQYMENETYVKVSGDWPEKYGADLQDQDGRVRINPLDLLINYDIQPTNGQIPGSEDPETWTQLFQIAAQNPQITQRLDWIKLFKHIGRNLGAKNVDDFIVEVAPDEQIRRQQEQGNLITQQQAQE